MSTRRRGTEFGVGLRVGAALTLAGLVACERQQPELKGSLGTIVIGSPQASVSDPRFDDEWKKLAGDKTDVFYIEDDRGEGLMGKVRRAVSTVPEPSPQAAASPPPGGVDLPNGDDVAGVIRTNLPGVKTCYLRMTRAGKMVNGKAIVSFTIDKDGVVQGVKIDAPNFKETDLPGCVGQQVAHWAFPKSKKGGLAVSYPFVFIGG